MRAIFGRTFRKQESTSFRTVNSRLISVIVMFDLLFSLPLPKGKKKEDFLNTFLLNVTGLFDYFRK